MGKFLFNPITGQLDQSGGSSLTLGTTAGTASEGNHTHAASAVISGTFDNARINFAAPDSIGSTTRNSGAFTTLNATNGTITASAPVLDLSQTWNNAATTFTAFRLNVTNTASNSASRIFDIQRGGTSLWGVNAGGDFVSSTNGVNARSVYVGAFAPADIAITSNTASIRLGIIDDTNLQREGTGTLAQRSATTAQTFRLYNTFTDASNYERGFMRWSSNVLQIGTEKGGTGSARALEFQTDGTTRLTIATNGAATFANGLATSGGWSFTSGHHVIVTAALYWNGGPVLVKDANNILGLRDGTNSHALRIYNTSNSSNANFERANFRWASNEFIIDAEAGGTGTSLRGIKIGSATSSLLGFYGVTPVDQPATVADPAGGGTVDTEARTAINAIIDRLQELGLIA